MENKQFIGKLNTVARENNLILPMLRKDEIPSGDYLNDWVRFLEICVKEGVSLSDDRWASVAMEQGSEYTRFWLDSRDQEGGSDEDFRVGLQLLMGLLGTRENESD